MSSYTDLKFIQEISTRLAHFKKKGDYLLERYKSDAPATPKPEFKFDFKPKIKLENDYISLLTSISDLEDEHPVRKYVDNRMIPEKYFDKLFLCHKFYEWAHKISPRKYNPRLVIPFYDTDGKVFAYQGRAFGNETPKYVTIKLDEDKDKIYGLERVNFAQHIYVVEGPIDSLFIDNCIAAGGADLTLDSKYNPEQVTYI